MAQDKPLQVKDIPLTGKLVTAVNSTMIGENFTILKNMRYADTNPETIGGTTKINTTALSTYLKVRSGIHYRKDQPSETHILTQAYNTGLTASQVIQNTTAIPGAGDFSATALGTDSTGGGLGRFSTAPAGEVVYCNGVDTVMWAGDEQSISGFYNYNPDGSYSYDFSEEVSNTLTTEYATVSTATGGLDSNTMLLLHLDNNVTDSSPTTAHTVTNVAAKVTFSTTTVFGTHSAVFNGTDAYLTIPDDADFDFSGGVFTIDGRFRVDSLASANPIYHQSITVASFPFTDGDVEPTVGDTLASPNAQTGTLHAFTVTSGDWSTNDAAGTMYITSSTISGAWDTCPPNRAIINKSDGDSAVCNQTATITDPSGDDHFHFYIDTDGSVKAEVHEHTTGTDKVLVTTAASIISIDTWYHLAVVENGDAWYIFVDGVLRGSAVDTDRMHNYTSVVWIGFDDTGGDYFDGFMDELRVSDSARWTSDFQIPEIAYAAASTASYFYVGSVRPIKGIKFYVGTANTASGTMAAQYWDGTKWVTVSSISDGTASGGVPLAQTGTVTFSDTVAVAKLKYLNHKYIYWYKVQIDSCDTTTTIYNVTLSSSMQSIKDIWDGELRTCFSFQVYRWNTYEDVTINVKEEDYSTANDASYVNLNPLTTGTDHIVCGFIEKQSGIIFTLQEPQTNGAIPTIYYWNGSTWATVGDIDDQTSIGGATLGKSGSMTWTPPTDEFKTTVGKAHELYYYKITFSANLGYNPNRSGVYLDYFAGIAAQENIRGFKFPLHAQDRVWLCSEESNEKNAALVSAFNTSVVFNGDDSQRFYFGDNTAITAGTSIYSQFGSSLYDIAIICKNTETWIVTGSGPSNWSKYKASGRIGCPAPLTMVQAHLAVDVIEGFNKYAAIWQSADGIFMFDGRTFFPIHTDIEDVFDKRNTNGINRDKIADSVGFFDNQNQEYHWLWASGSSTTLNKEYVFDVLRKKWFEIERPTDLQFGMEVQDTDGNNYNYGFIDTGFMKRLENGNDFDGTAITSTLQTGDMFLAGSPMIESTIRIAKIVMNGKSTTSNDMTLTHYGDASTTATISRDFSVSGSTAVMPLKNEKLGPFTTHKIKMVMTTDDETVGFEPLIISLANKHIRLDKN